MEEFRKENRYQDKGTESCYANHIQSFGYGYFNC